MKTLLIVLFATVAHLALGNAKLLDNAILESEQVQVVIKGDTARVEGTFNFRRITRYTKDASEPEGVYFPVVAPKGVAWTAVDFKLSLELNGHKATKYAVVTIAPVAVPDNDAYSLVWILASFPEQSRRTLQVVVQYEQTLLNGKFYYLPILGKAQPKPEGYEIRVSADRPIRSLGKGAGGVMVKGPRELVFVPTHLGMIVVVANAEPATQP